MAMPSSSSRWAGSFELRRLARPRASMESWMAERDRAFRNAEAGTYWYCTAGVGKAFRPVRLRSGLRPAGSTTAGFHVTKLRLQSHWEIGCMLRLRKLSLTLLGRSQLSL